MVRSNLAEGHTNAPTNKLTDARLRNLKTSDTTNLADGGSLYLSITDTGRRTWLLAYCLGGKQKTLVVGSCPSVKLAESRRARESVAAQYCEAEPAHILEGALTRTTDRYHAAIFDPQEVGAPNRAIRSYKGDPSARAGLLLCAYTFLRPGEVHSLEWTDFDVEGPVITIPAVRMKVPRPHKVPLPGQVLGILEGMRPISGGRRRHLLPSLRSEDQPMSDNTMNAALRWLGYPQGTMTVNGFRRIASTMLNEMGWNRDWNEAQLAHVEGNKVRRAYNAAEYLEDRTRMMQAWADHLNGLTAGEGLAAAVGDYAAVCPYKQSR